jgi:hypothetical protein
LLNGKKMLMQRFKDTLARDNPSIPLLCRDKPVLHSKP